MADAETIRVEILATAAQFRAELDSAIKKLAGPGGLKDALKDIPNQVAVDVVVETAAADSKLGRLREQIARTKAIIADPASMDVDIARAELKLEALKRKAEETVRAEAEASADSSLGGGGGGLLSGLGGIFSGGLPGVGAAATAGAPAILAAVGSLTAVVGSLGEALAGMGALAAGGFGALTVGLGSVAAVAIPAMSAVKEVTAAQDALTQAQERYGAGSKQARQAQVNLNAVVKEAGPGALALSTAVESLSDRWQTLSKPAQTVFFRVLTEGLHTISGLLPTIASVAKTALDAIDQGLQPVFKGLASPEFKSALLTLGLTFAQLAPPLIEGFANIFHTLMNVAIAAAPFVVEMAKGFAELTAGWVSSTSNGKALAGIVGGLVEQFRSWWGLISALGGLLVSLFSTGASAGQGLVNSLAGILREWTKWMNTASGQAALKRFFTDSANLVTALFHALAPLVAAIGELLVRLMPVFTSAINALAGPIRLVAGVIKVLAGVFGDGQVAGKLLAGVIVALGAAFVAFKIGQFLTWLKDGIALAGGLTAIVKGLWAAMLENPVGLVIGGLVAIGVALGVFGGHEQETRVSVEEVTKAFDAQREALKRLRETGLEQEQAELNKAEAHHQLSSAKATLATDKASGADRATLARDEDAVKQARIDLTRATRALNDVEGEATKTAREAASATHETEDKADKRAKQIERTVSATKDEIHALESVQRVEPGNQHLAEKLTGANRQLASEERELTKAQHEQAKATGQLESVTLAAGPAFQKLQGQIEKLWREGKGATAAGIAEINKLTLAEIKILDPSFTSDFTKGVGTVATGIGKALEFAGGGYIGQPGERGRDEVPVVVGRGEAILNHSQQTVVNHALAATGVTGGLPQLFSQERRPHFMASGGFAGGGLVVRGPASTFGPPGEPAGSTAYGSSSADPGIAVNPHGGGAWNDALANSLAGKVAKVILGSHSASLKVIDKGPSAVGAHGPRLIDVTGAGARAMGIDPAGFPTDSIAEAIFGEGGATVGAAAGAGGAAQIKAPKWRGPGGALGAVGKGAVAQAVKAANQLLASLPVNGEAGGPSSGGGAVGPAGGVAGLGTFDGLPVARWIIPELEYARAHGWRGHITSGYRPGFDPHTVSGFSEHSGTQYPHGAVDFGGYLPDPNPNRESFFSATAGYTGPKLIHPLFTGDGGHASGTGHALGGFAGRLFAGGGPAARVARHHASTPAKPKAPAHKAPKTPAAKALKRGGLIPADIAKWLVQIHSDEAGSEGLGTEYTHLLKAQELVPTEALVTLTDADVAALDPDGKLGYQTGDQLVNQNGMTVGRWFGPQGITGGSFVAGIDTRQGQIGALTNLLHHRDITLANEEDLDNTTWGQEQTRIRQRKEREGRIRKMLKASVARAKRVSGQLEHLTTGDLKANLKAALSAKAIAGRKGELGDHLASLRTELAGERKHQAQLVPIEKDTSYATSLEGQISDVTGAISSENRLALGGRTTAAVEHAKEAILKDSLKHQLKELTGENTKLGGSGLEIGTGGMLDRISKEVVALRQDQDTHSADLPRVGGIRYEIGEELGRLARESASLGGTVNIQVRTPGSGTGETDAQIRALVEQQLATTRQELALSEAQFGVFKGFAPLAAGRLVGTFATGIDRVPRTGPAIVHQGEVILPDPDGPYGNRAAAQARGAGAAGPVEVVIVMANNDTPLMKVIDARINERAPGSASDRFGQRSRLMAGVNHGR